MQAIPGPVSFQRPFIPNSFFASMLPWTGWVRAPKLSLPPGAGNPRYATDAQDCWEKLKTVSIPCGFDPTWLHRWPITFHCIARLLRFNIPGKVIFHCLLYVRLSPACFVVTWLFYYLLHCVQFSQFSPHDCNWVFLSTTCEFRNEERKSLQKFRNVVNDNEKLCAFFLYRFFSSWFDSSTE